MSEDLPSRSDLIIDPDFDARTMAVISGGIEPLAAEPGTVEVVAAGPTHLKARTTSEEPNLLVWQRSHLPLFQATLDGVAVPLEVVNLSRLGVRVPPGDHEVRISLDSSPFWRSFLAWLPGIFLLVWVVIYWSPRWSGAAAALLPEAARRESAKA